MKGMKETDIKDKEGNIVISPGLKVRHKKSQFEYTIDSVVKDDSGKIVVMLNSPESPRFKSKPVITKNLTDRNSTPVIYEFERIGDFSSEYYEPEEEGPEDLIAVPVAEFEKEYEIK
jgi:hypothetical protein